MIKLFTGHHGNDPKILTLPSPVVRVRREARKGGIEKIEIEKVDTESSLRRNPIINIKSEQDGFQSGLLKPLHNMTLFLERRS